MRAARAALLGVLLLLGIGGSPVAERYEDGSARLGWAWPSGAQVVVALPGWDGGDIQFIAAPAAE